MNATNTDEMDILEQNLSVSPDTCPICERRIILPYKSEREVEVHLSVEEALTVNEEGLPENSLIRELMKKWS